MSHWLEHEERKHHKLIEEMEGQFSLTYQDVKSEMAQDTHPDVVFEWRRSEFIRLGCSVNQADRLAASKMELRAFEKLTLAGCTVKVAERILYGTNFAGDDEPLTLETGGTHGGD